MIAAGVFLSQSELISVTIPNSVRTVTVSAILIIVACVIMLISSLSGCGGAFKRREKPIYAYIILAFIVLAMSIAGVIIAAVNSPQITSAIETGLTNIAKNEYGDPRFSSVTTAMDTLQKRLQCCGGVSYLEYTDSVWANTSATTATNANPVPPSCCISETPRCGQDRPNNAVIFTQSCSVQSGLTTGLVFRSVLGMGITACVIQGIAILCAFVLLYDLLYNEGKGSHSTTKVVIIKDQAS